VKSEEEESTNYANITNESKEIFVLFVSFVDKKFFKGRVNELRECLRMKAKKYSF